MAYFTREPRHVVVVKEHTDFELLPPHRNNPSTEVQIVKTKRMGRNQNYIGLSAQTRPLPVTDLTIFGGGIGPRRYYKPEKEGVPEFTSIMDDQWHSVGDNIVLKLCYKGHPEPMVQWSKGEQPMHCSRRIVVTADGTYTELAIFDAQSADGGFYNCRIENGMGVQERGCHVFIREGGPSGTAGSGALRAYRSVLYTPQQRYSRF